MEAHEMTYHPGLLLAITVGLTFLVLFLFTTKDKKELIKWMKDDIIEEVKDFEHMVEDEVKDDIAYTKQYIPFVKDEPLQLETSETVDVETEEIQELAEEGLQLTPQTTEE